MSKPLYENVKPRVIKRENRPPIDDDLRRLCLSTLAVLKRRYPNDWRRILNEVGEVKVA